jgi:hypothetical protein
MTFGLMPGHMAKHTVPIKQEERPSCNYRISWPIRCIVIFLLEILEKGKNSDECNLILVIY